MKSTIEKEFLKQGKQRLVFDSRECIGTIIVEHFPALGKLTALRFIEWLIQNPEGVISLPTGKTPEHFIKEFKRILTHWKKGTVQKELAQYGIDGSKKPGLKGLHFVQIDEFYPINPRQHNCFLHYINEYYIRGFGLDPKRALLINGETIGLPKGLKLEDVWGDGPVNLELRHRPPVTHRERLQLSVIEQVDQWCTEYEDQIRALGGIGFFLGGIGPDGHIGFNIRGSDMHSTTRLTGVNYETQAASATDLGGIEVASKRLVITIGLATITYNPKCVAIIMAAGDAKSKVVADAILNQRSVKYPATVLQNLPNSRFFITRGAAKQLTHRTLASLAEVKKLPEDQVEKIPIDLALEKKKKIADLTLKDYDSSESGRFLLSKLGRNIAQINHIAEGRLKAKIEMGMKIMTQTRFLHTEPHHDDIMLGYLPFIVRHVREHTNHHHFVTLTSGFTAVTNHYMLDLCLKLKNALENAEGRIYQLADLGYFARDNIKCRNRDVWHYLDGIAAESEEMKTQGQVRRFLRDVMDIFDEKDIHNIVPRVTELIHYFQTQYPGKKDLPYIQKLKGMCREWESACLWGYFGWDDESIDDLRLGFYQGDIFTESPTINRDVLPVLDLLRKVNPDVVSTTLDPEGSGPDTHYKVMQSISEALKLYEEETQRSDIQVLGYRNVWYRFHPSEANIFIPVSMNMFTIQHSSFMNTYISQKNASFPSYECDGPFSVLAQRVQVEQYQMLKTCLGPDFFHGSSNALLRAARGFVFIRTLSLNQFYQHTRDIKKQLEDK